MSRQGSLSNKHALSLAHRQNSATIFSPRALILRLFDFIAWPEQMRTRPNMFLYFVSLIFAIGCAGKNQIKDQYHDNFSNQTSSGRTVIVFLIDGLSLTLLEDSLQKNKIPNLKKFFHQNNNNVYQARTGFPSLTYPGIGSLITEKPVDEHGIIGNQILQNQNLVDFESPSSFGTLRKMLGPQNIYTRMREKGLNTVSISYNFSAQSDVKPLNIDTEVGLALKNNNFDYADNKLIDSLKNLLKSTIPANWPDFIFVHLVGVDFNSHKWGAQSVHTKKYLENLDVRLGPILNELKLAESRKKRQIVSILTADHGFDQNVKKLFPIESILNRVDPNIKTINEGRFVGLYFPQNWSHAKISAMLNEIAQSPEVDIVTYKYENTVFIESKKITYTFSYGPKLCPESSFTIRPANSTFLLCPDQPSAPFDQLFHPFFISNISHYFNASNHPDALIIAKTGVSFQKNKVAIHGGPTKAEVVVPLLMHNCSLRDPQIATPLWQLLRDL